MKPSQLRIIGGQWRSRQLQFQEVEGLRPTPARVRETLFNWLQRDIVGSRCLDLFAGSGALGVEAASRGAAQVVQVESDAQACRFLHRNREALQATQIQIVQQEVMRFLAIGEVVPFNVVFLDPPFHKGLAAQTCHWLEDKGWLAPYSKIYVEVERSLAFSGFPEQWQLLKEQTAGDVRYGLWQRSY